MNNKKFLPVVLSVFLVFTFLWGFNQNSLAADLKTESENQNRRAFTDFVSHLDGLETSLAKSKVAGTPVQQVYYLSQSRFQSETTVKDLSILPAKEFGLDYIDQFLNQIAEYAGVLMQQVTKGVPVSSEQEQTLSSMHERLIEVNSNVQDLSVRLETENISWLDKDPGPASWTAKNKVTPAAAQGDEGPSESPSSVRSGLEQLDSSLQKLPPFSYSGQTDTHVAPKPLGLPESTVTEEEARSKALEFLKAIGYPNADPQSAGTSNGVFAGYIFTYLNATIDVCKKGGVITQFRDERPLELQQFTTKETSDKAMQAIKDLGWKNFILTSTEDFGGYIQLEAVNTEQDIRIYPDKIRIIISKGTGKITGYDATAFWLYNHGRTLQAKLTPEQAKAKLRPDLTVKESRLAVISLPGYLEAFCYEFRCSKDNEEYLIYINAEDGIEEKIQRMIITPRGKFLQ